MNHPLNPEELSQLDGYFRAANYLSAAQIYLRANPLLHQPLQLEHVKSRLLGHWGTCPGLNLLYAHLNRVIVRRQTNVLYVTGPGHGGPALFANTFLEGSFSELYPAYPPNAEGIKRLCRDFSWPGGMPSHTGAETPGSIHEGGELGYSLVHAFGAAFDNPHLVVCCVIGDGEAETGPLAASWLSNNFLNPATDGAVLPVLHLNGYKIANPTVLDRIPRTDLIQLFKGHGYHPLLVEGTDPETIHQQLAAALDRAFDDIAAIQQSARAGQSIGIPHWPLIILATPKGWTGPKSYRGKPVEGSFRSHQVPIPSPHKFPENLALLDEWLRSYRPEELFDAEGRLLPAYTYFIPQGPLRMGSNPHANGGRLLKDLRLPDHTQYAVAIPAPGREIAESTRVLGCYLRDVMRDNMDANNFRVFGPDETASNRLQALFEVTPRAFQGQIFPSDDNLAPHGRVLEVLSEHLCQGWLEGYLLTGRHGFFSCYEAFIHIVDSMFNQHAKWLKVSKEVPWRAPIASLNYLLTSHVWRQDHNGFSHQDPGFIDHVVNKKAEIVRVYLPPDANSLLAVAAHCLQSRDYVNVIVAGKQPELQWLSMPQAERHCAAGLGIWDWASNDEGNPDLILACAGDVPTVETLAAVSILRGFLPSLRIRTVNIVDLMTLQPAADHPHGLADEHYNAIFPPDTPVIFAFHGYPTLIHRLTYRRRNHDHLHVRGYKEEGTTTTPFDMVVRNNISRFQLAIDALARLHGFKTAGDPCIAYCHEMLRRHKSYIHTEGADLPEVTGWRWNS
jgi:xylulose-5-phosphate/fructose-6-phosphate phosphoketolase